MKIEYTTGRTDCPIQKLKPTLSTGEVFHTNMSVKGYKARGNQISLEEYLASLREIYSSVVVKSVAVDSIGTQIEGDVAIFVGEKKS